MMVRTCQNKHLRRGMTLVEMLVALSLMALLVTTAVTWMTTIVSRQGYVQDNARWDRAAYAVFDQIGRDLNQLEMVDEQRRHGNPRVWIEQDALYIRTTAQRKPVTMQYAFDPARASIDRLNFTGPVVPRDLLPLLGGVEEFLVELIHPSTERSLPILRVEIRSSTGSLMSRTYPIRPEDVQR